MTAKRWAAGIAALFLLNTSAVLAQGRGHGHGKNKHGDNDSNNRYEFSPREQDSLREWYHDHESNLPPGLAKRDRLPPGLARQLRERGTLPPGLQKRIEPVPDDLERRLPPPPEDCDCRRVIIGGDIVLLNIRTNYVYGVFQFEIP